MAPDEATARAWAASENNVREALHPADEIREFGAMHERGVPVPSIAVAFGVTEPHVTAAWRWPSCPPPCWMP